MQLVTSSISLTDLETMAAKMFERLVKAVVDIEREIMVVDSGLHADEEFYLLENGSLQKDLWGINLHPDQFGTDDFIIFNSMINLRPREGNRSRGVENPLIQEKIRLIVRKLVVP